MDYNPAFRDYDRERCVDCGAWIPWPAMDDHQCRPCICLELGATGEGQIHTRCPRHAGEGE